MLVWITQKIDYYWGLFLQLDPATAILLFVTYGLIFEMLYVAYLTSVTSRQRFKASNLSVILYCISLFGLSEVLTNNIMYLWPVLLGTWAGNFIQITREQRKVKNETSRSDKPPAKDRYRYFKFLRP